jgi:hypothetical protein
LALIPAKNGGSAALFAVFDVPADRLAHPTGPSEMPA